MKTFLKIISAILGGVISSGLIYIQVLLDRPDDLDSSPMYKIMLFFMPIAYFPFGVVLGWAAAVAVMAMRRQEYHTVGKVCFWSGTINFLVLVIPTILSSLSRSRGENIVLDLKNVLIFSPTIEAFCFIILGIYYLQKRKRHFTP